MTVSGWCAPGVLGKPDHAGCKWEPCSCPCHTKDDA